MSEPTRTTETRSALFAESEPKRGSFANGAVIGAIAVVLVLLGALLLASRGHKTIQVAAIMPLAPQAATLPLTDVQMSESTSVSGGKSTYLDGHIRNTGSQTITGITVQVLFRNDVGLAPQTEVLPLQLIRAREPYIDTQPVSATPLAPGAERDFRLPFEGINENWNQQIPEIRIVQVTAK